jgi:hypothetical protein
VPTFFKGQPEQAGFVAYRKILTALTYLILSMTPTMLLGFNADLRQLLDDEWLSNVSSSISFLYLNIGCRAYLKLRLYFISSD